MSFGQYFELLGLLVGWTPSNTLIINSSIHIMMETGFLNKWLFYPWLKDSDLDNLIHPADLNKVNGIGVTQCIGIENDYLLVRYKNNVVRVKKEGVKIILPNPPFNWDENVYEIFKPEIRAQIDGLFWHHYKKQFLFYLKINGKRKSKWFSENELKSSDKISIPSKDIL